MIIILRTGAWLLLWRGYKYFITKYLERSIKSLRRQETCRLRLQFEGEFHNVFVHIKHNFRF